MRKPLRQMTLWLLGITLVAGIWMAIRHLKPVSDRFLSGQPNATPGSEAVTPPQEQAVPGLSKRIRPEVQEEDNTDDEAEPPPVSETVIPWSNQGSLHPEVALSQIVRLEDPEERREALSTVLEDWLTNDRNAALTWMKSNLARQSEEISQEIIDVVIGSWAADEPLPAMEWVNRDLPDPTKTQALKSLAEVWSQADPDGMEKWINRQDPPPAFWIGELIQGFTSSDPVRALNWCNRLADPAEAQAARQNVIQSWQLNEPDEADAYLKSHPSLVPAEHP